VRRNNSVPYVAQTKLYRKWLDQQRPGGVLLALIVDEDETLIYAFTLLINFFQPDTPPAWIVSVWSKGEDERSIAKSVNVPVRKEPNDPEVKCELEVPRNLLELEADE